MHVLKAWRNFIHHGAGKNIDAVFAGIAAAINNQDGRLIEPAGAECAIGMGKVMRDSNDRSRFRQQTLFIVVFRIATAKHAEVFVLHHEHDVIEGDARAVQYILHGQ